MAPDTRRVELIAEIAVLRKAHLDSLSEATFKGWTPTTEAAHDKRLERIAALQWELNALDPSSEP